MSKTPDQIRWAMAEWLKCTTLSQPERGVIEHLQAQAEVWDVVMPMLMNGGFAPVIFSAIQKAREQGILKSWEGFDVQVT